MISGFARSLVGAAAGVLLSLASAAANAASLIRDAEIEATLRAYADPIFEAAGLDAETVQVHIINSDRINAFVSGGLQMFVHTGLLTRARTPNEVIGVIAHETGHIEGGHLIKGQEEIENASLKMMISVLAGIAASVASGDGKVGAATQAAAQQAILRDLMTFSRGQEGSADQAAFTLLEKTHQSPAGMVSFFRVLEQQEALSTSQQDPYLQSHPLTRDRVDAAEAALARSPYKDAVDSPAMMMRHQRMLAKLNGYLLKRGQVLALYPEKDQSVPARYARAIAYYRASDLQRALAAMDSLLAEAPSDPFFLEQKAQILYENGKVAEALPLYQRALDLAPREPLIRMELAEAQLQLDEMAQSNGQAADPALLDTARDHLALVIQAEPKSADAYRLMAIVYGRQGNMPMADLYKAEQSLAEGKAKEAKLLAARALSNLPTGSPGAVRAEDIQFAAEQQIEDGANFTEPFQATVHVGPGGAG